MTVGGKHPVGPDNIYIFHAGAGSTGKGIKYNIVAPIDKSEW